MTNKNSKNSLITYADMCSDEGFTLFKSDKERIKYISNAYRNMSVSKAMSIFYGVEISQETKQNRSINHIASIEIGQVMSGTVKEITKQYISFEVPGVKEEIICKENFAGCDEHMQNYLITHNNKLPFEVREKKNGKYIVSVINAMYKQWMDIINKAIRHEDGIEVSIDALVQGGYLCHTPIIPLNNLTGRNYTHSVFIPGSHIVLNIEHDFEKWIGKTVIIVPQKFVQFKKNFKTGETEYSLVGSRKRVLQILGDKNIESLYNTYILSKNDNVTYTPETFNGVVTGIINSSKKTGIFVELADKYITGLLPVESYDLLEYKPGDEIRVKIKDFEVQEGKDPFIYNKQGNIIKCNVRLIFDLA